MHSEMQMMNWEQEVLANHRWGRDRDRAVAEHARLRKLWEAAGPLDGNCRQIVQQIVNLEICNWNLENDVPGLCRAIGARQPVTREIGHVPSVSPERWKRIWAYYLACRDWLPSGIPSGYGPVLELVDADAQVRQYVRRQLGQTDELKQLYVELFCLCLEFWIGGWYELDAAQTLARSAAVAAVRQEIQKRDPAGKMFWAFAPEGNGCLFPCHHKLFRRYDIILSSIGAGKWRGAMPPRGDGPAERAATVEKWLLPIQAWLDDPTEGGKRADEISEGVHACLGEPDAAKVFLAELLVSLLRAQQQQAEALAEARDAGPAAGGARPPDRQHLLSCPETVIRADGREEHTSTQWTGTQGEWSVASDGRILGQSEGNGYVYRNAEHADDVRVTATMQAVEGIEITVWICGSPEGTETDGYTLAVSTERAKLQRQGKDVASEPSVTIRPGEDHVLSFERRGPRLRGYLDGAADPFVEWTDPDPLRGEGHRTLGFYVWDGSIAVSNVQVEDVTA